MFFECNMTRKYNRRGDKRLESVASGYWTLSLNQLSGFVSH